jgi:hypothetical protein
MQERRKYKRYPMPRGTFVIMRGQLDRLRNHAQMSIGEIAMVLYKSEPEIMGQVTEMSLGGLSFSADGSPIPTADQVEMDLLMAEQGIYLHNIPFATIPQPSAAPPDREAAGVRTDAIHFKNLDDEQKGRIRELLARHSA